MPSNQGFVMTIKAQDGTLVPLYPTTTIGQVIDWNVGRVYGPYTLTIPASDWVENKQTIALEGITTEDIPSCVKVLSGTPEEMIAQDKAYGLLDSLIGIESLQNEVKFTCMSTPTIDLQVQVSWTV